MVSFFVNNFILQINETWTQRNKDYDFITNEKIIIHKDLDNKKNTAKNFIEELRCLAKNGKDFELIKSLHYQNKKSSGEYKNRFWKWEDDVMDSQNIIHIYFNKHENNLEQHLDLSLFKKNKNQEEINNFPGIKFLQYKKRNKSVRMLQEGLCAKGFLINEKEIGYYGKETCEAVREYYKKVLKVKSGTIIKDGKRFGPQGWKRLFD